MGSNSRSKSGELKHGIDDPEKGKMEKWRNGEMGKRVWESNRGTRYFSFFPFGFPFDKDL